ncbi:hypothetical protein [Bradyrhizobium sp. Gha]|uniref:hypothetical protein n=1 Tax=Bradyrhizobium sp. Gha TaxID=1855318 RepID=UPI0015A54D9D|nr:hypothetical protein [Bradyrhizobium sp. Gha]
MSVPSWDAGNFDRNCILKRLAGRGNHNEFAVRISALGGALNAACSGRHDVRSGAGQSRERQSVGVAVSTVSTRLVRIELIRRRKQRNAAQAEYHRLANVRLGIVPGNGDAGRGQSSS